MSNVILERSFPVNMEMTDGRTVEGLCVPYGMTADIYSEEEGRYQETFDLGAFSRVVRAPNRVMFRITHSANFSNMVGYGVELEERDAGLYGQFRLLEADAPKARELIKEAYRGLSIGFLPISNVRRGNVIHRVKAHLDHVAAVIEGTAAYSDAKVLAMREDGTPFYERTLGEFEETVDLEALNELKRINAEHRQYAAAWHNG
jgi:HK97 family phage prohead protease